MGQSLGDEYLRDSYTWLLQVGGNSIAALTRVLLGNGNESALSVSETQAQVHGTLTVEDATADTHALNRQAANALYQRKDLMVNDLTTGGTTTALSAEQGKVLKSLIDQISAVLASDDVSLDELQEIVDYIKANRGDIDSLGIAGVNGLQDALDGKLNLDAGGVVNDDVEFAGKAKGTGNDGSDEDEFVTFATGGKRYIDPSHTLTRIISNQDWQTVENGSTVTTDVLGVQLRSGAVTGEYTMAVGVGLMGTSGAVFRKPDYTRWPSRLSFLLPSYGVSNKQFWLKVGQDRNVATTPMPEDGSVAGVAIKIWYDGSDSRIELFTYDGEGGTQSSGSHIISEASSTASLDRSFSLDLNGSTARLILWDVETKSAKLDISVSGLPVSTATNSEEGGTVQMQYKTVSDSSNHSVNVGGLIVQTYK